MQDIISFCMGSVNQNNTPQFNGNLQLVNNFLGAAAIWIFKKLFFKSINSKYSVQADCDLHGDCSCFAAHPRLKIEWTFCVFDRCALNRMGIDHRCAHITVPQ